METFLDTNKLEPICQKNYKIQLSTNKKVKNYIKLPVDTSS